MENRKPRDTRRLTDRRAGSIVDELLITAFLGLLFSIRPLGSGHRAAGNRFPEEEVYC